MPLERVIGSTIHTWIMPDNQGILEELLQKGADEKGAMNWFSPLATGHKCRSIFR